MASKNGRIAFTSWRASADIPKSTKAAVASCR